MRVGGCGLTAEIKLLISNLGASVDASELEDTLKQISRILNLGNLLMFKRNRIGQRPEVFELFFLSDEHQSKTSDHAAQEIATRFSAAAGTPAYRRKILSYWKNDNPDNKFEVIPASLSDANDVQFDYVSVVMSAVASVDYALLWSNKDQNINLDLTAYILLTAEAFRAAFVANFELANPEPPVLGNREFQVLTWTSQGKTSFEIAKILNLSENTINNYVVNVTKKLGASNRTHAVSKAIHLGLI